ncbi:TolB family protein [Halobacillus amylolyticus]|uniref:Uncharacterized protein n=1 Tax=Halobacillus amylolyticus TaxID=2932259 RepID=A0ABY4H700_9BACI|nr:hypothetical protein [Halobacillus amylolyticus]UOR10552.1 hypothetical protein MUO15_12795 [Halobacillus amylolyticus]
MSLKKKNSIFIAVVTIVSVLLYWGGTFADGPSGYTGLGHAPALSPDDTTIAFSYFHNGEAALYTSPSSGGEAQLLHKPDQGYSYIRPSYSPGSSKLVFIKQWEEEERLRSQLMIYNEDEEKVRPLIGHEEFVTEAVFSPDGEHIYFLKAGVYKNYSDIAQKKPHDFDIFKMNIKSGEIEQITSSKAYTMSSLQVSSDGEQLLYSTFDGKDVIKMINLESKNTRTITPGPDYTSAAAQGPILSSPSLSPDGKTIAFSDVGSKSEHGTYQYELFMMNHKGEKVEQVTNFHEHVSQPIFFHHSSELLVTINRNFAGRNPDNEYWRMEQDGSHAEEILIEIPSKGS